MHSISEFLLFNDYYYSIVFLSLMVSLSAIICATFFSLLVSCLIVLNNFKVKEALILAINTLMSLPPVVVGLILYILFSQSGIFGSFNLLYTSTIMIIAQVIIVSPIIISLSIKELDNSYIKHNEYLNSLYTNKYKISMTLIYEQRFEIILILLTALGRALSEVGAIIIVGGNIANVTRVMTSGIVLETSRGNLSLAMSLGGTLILIALLLNLLTYFFKKKIL